LKSHKLRKCCFDFKDSISHSTCSQIWLKRHFQKGRFYRAWSAMNKNQKGEQIEKEGEAEATFAPQSLSLLVLTEPCSVSSLSM